MKGMRIFSDEAVKVAVQVCLRYPHQPPSSYLHAVAAESPEFVGKTDKQLRNLLQSERVARVFDLDTRTRVLKYMRLERCVEDNPPAPPKPPLDLRRFSYLARQLAITAQPPASERWRYIQQY